MVLALGFRVLVFVVLALGFRVWSFVVLGIGFRDWGFELLHFLQQNKKTRKKEKKAKPNTEGGKPWHDFSTTSWD